MTSSLLLRGALSALGTLLRRYTGARYSSYVSGDLSHFVGQSLPAESQYQLLLKIVREGRLLPTAFQKDWSGVPVDGSEHYGPVHHQETHFGEKLSANSKCISGVVCFCDIPEGSLARHLEIYGKFGLSFPKRFLVAQGATPVFYVARDSAVRDLRIQDVRDPRRGLRSSSKYTSSLSPNSLIPTGQITTPKTTTWSESGEF
jgi:hypothetical protein